MATITAHNYEAFYLDYIEGNLDAELTAQLLLFLENNPALKAEIDDFELVSLTAPEVHIENKSLLKKEINESSIDDYIIADLENTLDASDKTELRTLITSKPELKKLETRYSKTILIPPTVVYPHKEKLKKREAVIFYLIPTAIAAALLLLILTWPKTDIDVEHVEPIVTATDNSADNRQEAPTTYKNTDNSVVNTSSREENTGITSDKNSPELIFDYSEQSPVPLNDIELKLAHSFLEDSLTRPSFDTLLASPSDDLPFDQLVSVDSTTNDKPKALSPKRELASNDPETLSMKEWVNRTIRKKLLRHRNPSSKHIASNELLAAVSDRLDNGTKTDISYNYGTQEKQQRKFFRIRIGKFEFYRTKKQ